MLDDLPLARTVHPALDRDGERRDPASQQELRADPRARCLLVTPRAVTLAPRPASSPQEPGAAAGQDAALAPTLDATEERLELRPLSEVLAAVPGVEDWPAGAPHGLAYLGLVEQVPHFALLVLQDHPHTSALLDPQRQANVRDVAPLLGPVEADLAVAATALACWHTEQRHCSRCGERTRVCSAGWVHRCPVEGSLHFPRTDPAVIMLITDAADRVLLAHAAHFPPTRYSCLAGFVEAGETLENAVRREVAEEADVAVGEVTYLASQPWPFPRSLMLGYRGRTVEDAPTPRPDGTEVHDVRFFSRQDVARECAQGTLTLPGGASIARVMLRSWYDSALPDEHEAVRQG